MELPSELERRQAFGDKISPPSQRNSINSLGAEMSAQKNQFPFEFRMINAGHSLRLSRARHEADSFRRRDPGPGA